MPVAVFVAETCAPAITDPDGSVTTPARVAPVTCEYVETAKDRLKTRTVNRAKKFVSFRGSRNMDGTPLSNDHAMIIHYIKYPYDCDFIMTHLLKRHGI